MSLIPPRPGIRDRWLSSSMLSSPLMSSPQSAAVGPAAGPLTISGSPTPATQNVAYSWSPSVDGGTPPYSFSKIAGSVPAGMSFHATRPVIDGTPSGTGTSSGIQIRVTDSASPTPATADETVSIVVSAQLVLTNAPATTANINSAYSYAPTTTGGRAPLTWAITNKPSWGSFSTSTGALTGTTPGAPETDTGIIIAGTDADGRTVTTGAFQIAISAIVAPAPAIQTNMLYIGDSTTAGRGAGTGTLGMDGARALAFPTMVAARLNALSITATTESFNQAGNTLSDEAGLMWSNYDPRINRGTWGSGVGTVGGAITSSSAASDFTFTPAISVDTFDVYLPILSTTTPVPSFQIDAGTTYAVKQTQSGVGGALRVEHFTFSAGSLASHVLHINRTGGNPQIISGVGSNSTVADIRVINMGIRGITSGGYAINGGNVYDPLPAMIAFGPNLVTFISLGINDMVAGGNSLAIFSANMQTIITQQLAYGEVILMIPTPIQPSAEVNFTQAQLAGAYATLSTNNGNLTVIDAPSILGAIYGSSPSVWDAMTAAGQTFDSLHLKATPYQQLGSAIGDVIAAKGFASSTAPNNYATYLAVAGGGGGGNGFGPGGGGGGGGVRQGGFLLLPATTYTVTVGTGGAGGVSGAASHAGVVGSPTTLTTAAATSLIYANSGGGGGSGVGVASGGGSGGGASAATVAALGTPGQGWSGGAPAALGSGGGGGATGVGADGTAGVAGAGGPGITSSITGSPVVYGAGGGGGGTLGGAAGGGGAGAGGSTGAAGGAGTANTGGGAGGSQGNLNAGGVGGSGKFVIVVKTGVIASTTGSPTITVSGANTIYEFNASGTFTTA